MRIGFGDDAGAILRAINFRTTCDRLIFTKGVLFMVGLQALACDRVSISRGPLLLVLTDDRPG